jgi:hypothetical protein
MGSVVEKCCGKEPAPSMPIKTEIVVLWEGFYVLIEDKEYFEDHLAQKINIFSQYAHKGKLLYFNNRLIKNQAKYKKYWKSVKPEEHNFITDRVGYMEALNAGWKTNIRKGVPLSKRRGVVLSLFGLHESQGIEYGYA